MRYNKLGKAGIRLSELGFGSWITFAKQLSLRDIKELMHVAHDHGITFFDNAEGYAHGEAETLMGTVLKDFKREELVVSTKLFWGGNGPNDTGLSRKHLIEGTKNSLKRLRLDYVDLLFCHRPDAETSIEETVLAMDYLVRQNFAFYWGTSEWSADQIQTAITTAEKLGCIKPSMEQPKYNVLARERIDRDYAHLIDDYGLGTTTWSPLASGILSGKYSDGIPQESRLAKEAWLIPDNFKQLLEKVQQVQDIAHQLDCTPAQLAIAWCLKNKRVSAVITGATKVDQLLENLGAIDVKEKLTPDVMAAINKIGMNDT